MNPSLLVLDILRTPDRAWIVLLAGIVLIYRECLAPGRVLPGVAGGLGVILAVYSLAQHPWRGEAAGMIAAGTLLLFVQAFRRWFWIPGILAAMLIPLGAARLTQPSLSPVVAGATVPVIGVTIYLLRIAVMARRNKVSLE